jgi:PilZ domain-containing protein
MLSKQMTFARRQQGALSRIVPDRRRYKRISVTLLGRFMRESKEEHPCKLVDVSAGGAAVTSLVSVPLGERVVAYFDHIGGIEGVVVRVFDGGFAFSIAATKHKREKLAAQLTWLANRSELGNEDGRRHERITPQNGEHTLQLAEGIVLTCRVLDISISGASIATPARPEIGTEVVLGKLRARVMRHHPEGFGVQFLDIQNPTALRRYFG